MEGAGFVANVVGRGAVADSDSAILRISGMTCSSCSSAVEGALLSHEGVQVNVHILVYMLLRYSLIQLQSLHRNAALSKSGCGRCRPSPKIPKLCYPRTMLCRGPSQTKQVLLCPLDTLSAGIWSGGLTAILQPAVLRSGLLLAESSCQPVGWQG